MSFNRRDKDFLDLLLSRRSAKAKMMHGPGPTDDELQQILSAGMRVPDHGKLAPWRFIVFKGQAQEDFGDLILAAYEKEETHKSEAIFAKISGFPSQAPVMIAVTSDLKDSRPIPEIEQRLSAGAACQNILLAATALGYAVNWLTGWSAASPGVKKALDVKEDDHIAGFIFIGNSDQELTERPRPDFDDVVHYWQK